MNLKFNVSFTKVVNFGLIVLLSQNVLMEFQVQFEDRSELKVKREEFWSQNEDLPKRVKSKMVSWTE